jgi:nucleotide-binding universal stress UspA family protein
MKKRVLAAIDLGFDEGWERRARLAIDQALVIASPLGGVVDVVHVSDVSGSGGKLQQGAVEILKRFSAEQKERLARLSSDSRIGRGQGARSTAVSPVFIKGDPATKLIQLSSKRAQYECLVLSTHGRSGLSRMLMGSVAEELVRHSKIPVVCVGPRSGSAGPAVEPVHLIATDLGTNSRKAEKCALEWAVRAQARGVLYHSLREGLHPVLQSAYGAGPGSKELEELLRPHRMRALKALELRSKAWKRKGLACDIVLDESPHAAESGVLEAARSRGATLIFMGTHGRSLAARAFIGSTAREVLLGSSVPVVSVRS